MSAIEDVKNQAREFYQLTQTNSVKLACTVVSVFKSEPKPRVKDGMIVMDEKTNEPLYYPPRHSINVVFTGGAAEIPVTETQYNNIEVGGLYMLIGRQGLVKSFGNESLGIIYDSISKI